MTLIRSRSSWALCALALWFPSTSLMASDDGGPAQDVGIVHASGDEAWIDLPASLNDTWKATLAELKERGHLDDAELSYVESNGQIALETLWVAVVPGASLGAPISRVRIVVLVGADELERRTAALVGAGALLGAIAERLPARGPIPSPFVGPAPAGEAEPATEAAGVRDDLVTSYD
ncbi:MAG TPA: hypothetical protein VFD43_12895, partial [Planctomycetota bacterium]|nr:hypothetical protein [Planctomycetota bacterium]